MFDLQPPRHISTLPKLTKPHAEHMFSGLLPIADVSSDQ
jgi:hypothetical protein